MTDVHKMKTAELRNIIKKYKIETGKKIRPISRLTKSKLIEIINEYQMVGDGDAGEAYTPGKPESDDESETLDIVEGVNDMDVMMALMEDLNIRGATAFVHLVQNADEFQAQVDDLSNSAGSAAQMAEIQQKSLQNQIQLVRNAMQAPFLMSDEIGEAAGYTNELAMVLHGMVKEFESLIVVEREGVKQLTEFGEFLRDFVIEAMKELGTMMHLVVDTIKEFGDQGDAATKMLHLFTVPLTIVLKLIKSLGPELLTTYLLYSKLTQILPINIGQMVNMIQLRMADISATRAQIVSQMLEVEGLNAKQIEQITAIGVQEQYTMSIWKQVGAMAATKLAMFGMIFLLRN